MVIGRLLNKIINIFTGLFAISTLILMLVWYVNSAVGGFLMPDSVVMLERVRNYFSLATVFCAGTEFTLKRNLFVAIIFAAIVVAVAAFTIYSDIVMA